jgi:hypothetical protein
MGRLYTKAKVVDNSKISMFVFYLMQISTIKMVTYVTLSHKEIKLKKGKYFIDEAKACNILY